MNERVGKPVYVVHIVVIVVVVVVVVKKHGEWDKLYARPPFPLLPRLKRTYLGRMRFPIRGDDSQAKQFTS